MSTILLRVVLYALVFMFVFPHIPGLHFVGAFWPDAVMCAVFFTIVSWLVALLLSIAGVMTLGIGFLIQLLLFWLVGAVQLLATEWLFPGPLTIDGWTPAILGGLVLIFINWMTADRRWRH